MRFTFDLAAHSRMGSFVEPSFEIWVEVGPAELGFTKRWIGRDQIVSRVFTIDWADDDQDRSVARIMAQVVENICYPRSLSKPARASLFKEIKAYIPDLVRDVIGVTVDQIGEQIAERKERDHAAMERRMKAWEEAPAPDTGHSWEERGRIGGHFY